MVTVKSRFSELSILSSCKTSTTTQTGSYFSGILNLCQYHLQMHQQGAIQTKPQDSGSPTKEALKFSLTYQGPSGPKNTRCIQHSLRKSEGVRRQPGHLNEKRVQEHHQHIRPYHPVKSAVAEHSIHLAITTPVFWPKSWDAWTASSGKGQRFSSIVTSTGRMAFPWVGHGSLSFATRGNGNRLLPTTWCTPGVGPEKGCLFSFFSL
jgi:hypothetical protein